MTNQTLAKSAQEAQAPAPTIAQQLTALAAQGQPLAVEALMLVDTCDEMYSQLQDRTVIGWERGYLLTGLEHVQRRIEVMLRELDLEAA